MTNFPPILPVVSEIDVTAKSTIANHYPDAYPFGVNSFRMYFPADKDGNENLT